MMFLNLTLVTLVAFTLATPIDQDQLAKKSFGSVVHNLVSGVHNTADSAVSVLAAAAKRGEASLPQPPSDNSLQPLGNAALDQEALNQNKANAAANITNAVDDQNLYQLVQWVQGQENSSLNINSELFGNSVSAAKIVSTTLQSLQVYPQRFDQAQSLDPAKSIIEISSTPQQTIQSFGASGAWWPNFLNDFPWAQKENLSTLLFSEDGLYLSGYRYNMGASGDQDSQLVSTPGRGVQSFMKTDGSYDFSRDGPGIYYANAAHKAGASIAFFVNAAPSALTANKKPCGNTLDPSTIPQFVAYVENVLTYWSNNNLKMAYISPMNEPDNNFKSCTQEGMAVATGDRATVFSSLKTALQGSDATKDIKIMGDESSQIAGNALANYGDWLSQGLPSIDALSVHMYDWPDDMTLGNYATLIKNISLPNAPPPVKMTEISTFKSALGPHAPWGWTGPNIMKGTEWDPTINNALDMARYMWQWLTIVNAESWDWWTAVSNMMPCSPGTTPSCGTDYSTAAGFNDGLLYIDPYYLTTKDYQFYFTKRYWVFRHFSKFIRPGSVRYDIPNEVLPYGTVAVASQGTDKTWNALFINRNATAQAVTMKLPGAGGKIVGVTQTTNTQDWGTVPPPTVAKDDTVKLTLPAKGVLSMQFTVNGPISARSGEDEGVGDEVLGDRRRGVEASGGPTLKRLNHDL